MWASGLSNTGQAYRLGQQPFFGMQGMLPMAGLQPGGGAGLGMGGGAPILGKPMLPPGVTEAMAALPGMLPGLGAKQVVPVAKPQPVAVKKTSTIQELREQGRGIDAKADRAERDARSKSGGSKSKGHGGAR